MCPLLSSNFIPSFRKILRPIFEKSCKSTGPTSYVGGSKKGSFGSNHHHQRNVKTCATLLGTKKTHSFNWQCSRKINTTNPWIQISPPKLSNNIFVKLSYYKSIYYINNNKQLKPYLNLYMKNVYSRVLLSYFIPDLIHHIVYLHLHKFCWT